CPALTGALAAVERGDVDAAARHLATLNEDQRLLATFLVEIAAAKANAAPAALAGLCADLHALAENTIDLNDVPGRLLAAWAQTVAPALAPAVVARRDAFGYSQTLLCQCIEHLCAQDAAASAVGYAALLNPYHRSDVAQAWSRVGLALSVDHADRADALMRAAQVGSMRPMIQDGGEEASAHGVAMQAFARGGIAPDAPAVGHTLKGLLKLGRHRARKDVRSHGVATASIAASERALQSTDAAWLAIAEQLAALVWDEGPMQTDALRGVQEARAAIDPSSRAAAPVGAPEAPDDRLESLARRCAAGEDVDAQTEAALGAWDRYANAHVRRFIKGCRLGLDDARLEALLDATKPDNRPEALIKGAAYALEASDARRAAWLNRGYPEGDPYSIFSADLLHLLTPDRILAGELFYAGSGQTKGLAQLIGLYMQRGAPDDAARVIARIGQPAIDGAWVPAYRRGNRAGAPLPAANMVPSIRVEPTPVTADTLKAALSQTKAGSDLLALALGAEDAATLAKVVKASRLKKWAKKAAGPWIARIRLHAGDLDDAIAVFEGWATGRYNEHQAVSLLHTLADHLRETGTATPDRVRRLVALIAPIHPQWPVYALAALARAAMHVEPGERDALTALIRSTIRSRYRRAGDWVFGLMGLAHGRIDVGDIDAGRALLAEAVTCASRETMYFKGTALLVTLAQVAPALPPAELKTHCVAALQACTRHEKRAYAQLMQVERGLRTLWPRGVDVTIALFAPAVLPQVLARDLRRSLWADIAYVPEPLRVLEALWPTEAVLPEIAMECVDALVKTLALTDHPALADVQTALAAARAA
ncbi:MAG: hypothetical protein ACI9U2_004788, partial [Bradymonadia bacterium]